jgi:hypothetical protein
MRPDDDPRSLLARVRAQLRSAGGRLARRDLERLVELVERHLRLVPYLRHDPGCAGDGRLGRPAACSCGLSRAALDADERCPD